jgi:hypothetical protein
MTELESKIMELTCPINGQYPRPWMTGMMQPDLAQVFIVGKNQAKTFDTAAVGDHTSYIDALFNRPSGSCRAMYDNVTGGRPSPTRLNIDQLTNQLECNGVTDIIETNAICYSTPMGAALREDQHQGGFEQGTAIFNTLLEIIRPRVLIAHGATPRKKIAAFFGQELPPVPDTIQGMATGHACSRGDYHATIYLIRSLAPPAVNMWTNIREDVFASLSRSVSEQLMVTGSVAVERHT